MGQHKYQRQFRDCVVSAVVAAVVMTTLYSQASPLDGKPPILQQRLMGDGRVELMPRFGMTIYNTYETHFLPGLSVNYFILDWLAIGIDLQYGLTADTALHTNIDKQLQAKRDTICPATLDSTSRSSCLSALGIAPSIGTSSIEMLALANLSMLPVTGKFMLYGSLVRYDVHVVAGAGVGLIRSEGDKDVLEDDFSMAAMAGIGARFFVNDWFALNLEARDVLVQYHEATDQGGDLMSKTFHNHFELSLGFSFFLPINPTTQAIE
jgi:outer membrane beta-barrel protein